MEKIIKADPEKGLIFITWMLERLHDKKLIACFEGALEEAESLCLMECPIEGDDHFQAAQKLWEGYRSVTNLEEWYEGLGKK